MFRIMNLWIVHNQGVSPRGQGQDQLNFVFLSENVIRVLKYDSIFNPFPLFFIKLLRVLKENCLESTEADMMRFSKKSL